MYDRRDLVRIYLGAQHQGFGGYYPESSTFNAALKAYYTAMLDGLQELFDLRLRAPSTGGFNERVLLMLFFATARSFLAVTTPWAGFLEAGLLIRTIDEAGANGQRVMAASSRIDELAAESRQTHLEMLDAIITVMLGDRAELTFSSGDLRAIGVDDSEPNPTDYPLYDD